MFPSHHYLLKDFQTFQCFGLMNFNSANRFWCQAQLVLLGWRRQKIRILINSGIAKNMCPKITNRKESSCPWKMVLLERKKNNPCSVELHALVCLFICRTQQPDSWLSCISDWAAAVLRPPNASSLLCNRAQHFSFSEMRVSAVPTHTQAVALMFNLRKKPSDRRIPGRASWPWLGDSWWLNRLFLTADGDKGLGCGAF